MAIQSDSSAAAQAASKGLPAFLGTGLLRPFRRDQKSDFASGSGLDNVKACVGQVLGTRATSAMAVGEVPWRSDFGSRLHLLRHKGNKETLGDLAVVMIEEALLRWEPRARVTLAEVVPQANARVLLLRVRFNIVDQSGRVVTPDQSTDVPIPLSAA